MKARNILICFLKFIGIIVFTLVVTFIMALLYPPPKGTAFDGLDYVLKPVYLSFVTGIIYLVLSLSKNQFEKKLFLLALLVNFIYVVLLYLRVLN